MNRSLVEHAFEQALAELLARRRDGAWWEGRLDSSAVATATAASALLVADRDAYADTIAAAIGWLLETQNADGGWGDTPGSPSNMPATVLTLSALALSQRDAETSAAGKAAWRWLRAWPCGIRTPHDLPAAITRHYGADRTFAAPILFNAALAGLTGFDDLPRLPYELTLLPQRFYSMLKLDVVSYALPALIALGIAIDVRQPRGRGLRRSMGRLARRGALETLEAIQPSSGGFLEAIPLSSFVVMALAPLLGASHPVVARSIGFLTRSARPDGSWPIDVNLSVWVTTRTVLALDAAGCLDCLDAEKTATWIARQQRTEAHPYTGAAPGGWGWTHLPGSVPDTDDTSGALLALKRLGHTRTCAAGRRWLTGLQNADGGWPTFCRGWNRLPFDTSCPDLTAHALHALWATSDDAACGQYRKIIDHGLRYLERSQRADGAWLPLWFGNQHAPGQANPVIGTSFTLDALLATGLGQPLAERGARYLFSAQNGDGGWGGDPGVASTVEETALALSALSRIDAPQYCVALERAAHFLAEKAAEQPWKNPSPIGLYFASLWYGEESYPTVWLVQSLGRMLLKR